MSPSFQPLVLTTRTRATRRVVLVTLTVSTVIFQATIDTAIVKPMEKARHAQSAVLALGSP